MPLARPRLCNDACELLAGAGVGCSKIYPVHQFDAPSAPRGRGCPFFRCNIMLHRIVGSSRARVSLYPLFSPRFSLFACPLEPSS
jgi:hypothetical protein